MQTSPEPREETVEDILKGSFLKFVWFVWLRVLLLPVPTRIQLDISRYLQDGPRLRFIAAFRGVGKTFLTAAYIVWRLWRDPNIKIVVVSANERFAATVASFIHTLINATDALSGDAVPWASLKAKSGQRDSTMLFDVGPAMPSKDPSLIALGINGQLAGSRADLLLFDDVEVPNNSETEGQREKLVDRIGEAAALRKPGGETIYLGTFQSMASVYKGLKAKGYAMRLWPARYPLPGKETLYEDLAPLLKADIEETPALREPRYGSTLGGAPTDPARFNEEDLMERETEWGSAGFQLQFMLDTSLTDQERFPLKTTDLIVMDADPDRAPIHVAWSRAPKQMLRDLDNIGFDGDRFFGPMAVSEEWKPYTASLMEIDPSGSGSDETAYAIGRFLSGRIWVTMWGGFKDGHSPDTLQALAKIAVEQKVPLVRVEGNFGDGMFARLLETELRREGYKGAIEVHKVHGMKEARIVGNLQPVLRNHRMVMSTEVIQADLAEVKAAGDRKLGRFALMEYSGLYQLTHMANQRGALRKDDRVDVLSNMVSYFLEIMSLDSEKAERDEKRKHDEEFAKLVVATQLRGAHFVPDEPRRVRGAGRNAQPGRSPKALKRALKARQTATWRRR
jgi:hypothetical protein